MQPFESLQLPLQAPGVRTASHDSNKRTLGTLESESRLEDVFAAEIPFSTPSTSVDSTGRRRRWALRMVDDSFRDQIDLLRQAAWQKPKALNIGHVWIFKRVQTPQCKSFGFLSFYCLWVSVARTRIFASPPP